jgi:hypothetical protein
MPHHLHLHGCGVSTVDTEDGDLCPEMLTDFHNKIPCYITEIVHLILYSSCKQVPLMAGMRMFQASPFCLLLYTPPALSALN